MYFVYVAKYRKFIFSKKMIEEPKTVFDAVCKKSDCNLVECDGEKDHVHLLIDYPPKLSVSKIVNSLKGVSSRMLRKKFEKNFLKFITKVFCGRLVLLFLALEVQHLKKSKNTSNNRTHQNSRALYPSPEGVGFTARLDNLVVLYKL